MLVTSHAVQRQISTIQRLKRYAEVLELDLITTSEGDHLLDVVEDAEWLLGQLAREQQRKTSVFALWGRKE